MTKRPRLAVTIPADILEKLTMLAEKQKRTLSSVAEEVIQAGLKNRENSEIAYFAPMVSTSREEFERMYPKK